MGELMLCRPLLAALGMAFLVYFSGFSAKIGINARYTKKEKITGVEPQII